jgi:hypothetical protein
MFVAQIRGQSKFGVKFGVRAFFSLNSGSEHYFSADAKQRHRNLTIVAKWPFLSGANESTLPGAISEKSALTPNFRKFML